jgi:hypothetical protein
VPSVPVESVSGSGGTSVAAGDVAEAATADAIGVESGNHLVLQQLQQRAQQRSDADGTQAGRGVEDVFWAAQQGVELRLARHVGASSSEAAAAMSNDGEGGAHHLLATV